jgi:hypothetical protein
VATRETEQNLLELARYVTAGQLEVVVRSYRGVLNYELGGDGPERRYVRLERDDDGSLLIQARLPAEEGAVVAAALEAGRDALRESRSSRSLGGADGPADAEADDPDQVDSGAPSAMGEATPEASPLKQPISGTRRERMGATATDRRPAERRRLR